MTFRLFQLVVLVSALAATGCCGGQLCAVRFREPVEHLGQTPDQLPYCDPPVGFRTVGGPPNLIPEKRPRDRRGWDDGLAVNAPLPKFLPAPTRPVFGGPIQLLPISHVEAELQLKPELDGEIYRRESPTTSPLQADPPSPLEPRESEDLDGSPNDPADEPGDSPFAVRTRSSRSAVGAAAAAGVQIERNRRRPAPIVSSRIRLFE